MEVSVCNALGRFAWQAPVKRIDAALVARGRTLFKEGEPIADSSTRQGVISELYDTFRSSTLPELIRQGIVTRD